jgi:preprotein translocase subunit SecA
LKEKYQVSKLTFIPSVFGENRVISDIQMDFFLEDSYEKFYDRIQSEIRRNIGEGNREVLIFFLDKSELEKFKNSHNRNLDNQTYDEISNTNDGFDSKIRVSTTAGRVTLLVSDLGRGTDFICRDKRINSNGGLHVIQTFFSENASEEKQIRGGTGFVIVYFVYGFPYVSRFKRTFYSIYIIK